MGPEIRPNFGRHIESFGGRQPESGAGRFAEFRAAFAMALGGAGHFGDAFADDGFGDDHLGPAVVVGLGFFQRHGEDRQIVAIHRHGIPTLGHEELFGIFALRDRGHRVERDIVGIINEDQIVETIVAGEGDGFAGDAFLQAAISHQGDHVMIENRVLRGVETSRRAFAGEGETHRVADPLAERAGGRFDPRGFMKFRVAGRERVQLAEIFQVLAGDGVAGQMQPAVEKHRPMAGGKHEAVAIEPFGRIRIVAQRLAEQDGPDFRAAERQSEVTGGTGVDGIDGQPTGFVGGFGEGDCVHRNRRKRKVGQARRSVAARAQL